VKAPWAWVRRSVICKCQAGWRSRWKVVLALALVAPSWKVGGSRYGRYIGTDKSDTMPSTAMPPSLSRGRCGSTNGYESLRPECTAKPFEKYGNKKARLGADVGLRFVYG